MTDQEIKEAMDLAVDRLFDVGIELERRGWGRYLYSDAARLAGKVEEFRDDLSAQLKVEAADAAR